VLAVLDEQGLVFAQAAGLRRNGQRLRTLFALPECLRREAATPKARSIRCGLLVFLRKERR